MLDFMSKPVAGVAAVNCKFGALKTVEQNFFLKVSGIVGLDSALRIPHHNDADPDPAFHSDADTDPAFHLDADTDPAFYFDADPVVNMIKIDVNPD